MDCVVLLFLASFVLQVPLFGAFYCLMGKWIANANILGLPLPIKFLCMVQQIGVGVLNPTSPIISVGAAPPDFIGLACLVA
eukprot:scaffold268141_cov12-Tisochrysis_lutea.AAC.1